MVVILDDEVPTVKDCPLYLEVIEDFSKTNTVSVLWPEPRFFDNIAVTQVSKTMVKIYSMLILKLKFVYISNIDLGTGSVIESWTI